MVFLPAFNGILLPTSDHFRHSPRKRASGVRTSQETVSRRTASAIKLRMNGPRQLDNLVLIGFMGTGKSSVGRMLASQLQFDFIDTDELIEARIGKTISEIFSHNGEAAFRQIERDLVEELSERHRVVVSTGGGLAANEENLKRLKETALVVCLWASPETIWERVRHQTHRPLLRDSDPLAKIRRLLAERERYYRQADVLMNTEMRSTKEVAQHVLHQFRLAQRKSS
jgi:shikimate kinase